MRAAICAVALTLAFASGARADENDRLTYMTFSGPVQIPGVTLAAGTYTFKLADTQGDRHLVQVFTKDDNKLITTLMTIPNERLEPVKDTFVMFAERPAGTPVAVKAWFYPGRSIGEEFMYPRQQAVKIAKAVHEPVLTAEGDETKTTGAAARVDEAGSITKDDGSATAHNATTTADDATTARNRTTTANRASTSTPPSTVAESDAATRAAATTAPQSAANTASRSNSSAQATTASPRQSVGTSGQATTANQAPADRAATAPRRGSLPRTASPLALYELLSGLSLAAGFGVRQLRRRS